MRWIWIDRILELDKAERCVAVKNVSLAEDHLHDHFPADAEAERPAVPVMPGSLMIEGMAQTAGILVGHARDFTEKVILAKIGRVSLDRDIFPGQTLFYTAQLERIDENGASTSGSVDVIDHAAEDRSPQPVGRIELTFSHIDHNRGGHEFPEHNFVFTEQFMSLLRNSGFG